MKILEVVAGSIAVVTLIIASAYYGGRWAGDKYWSWEQKRSDRYRKKHGL